MVSLRPSSATRLSRKRIPRLSSNMLSAVTQRQNEEIMTSILVGHIILTLTPTQPVESGRLKR